ncbi:hypothetical protein HPP92_001078 [Vanilla planifolia]|uniref:Uncharacterized protein n=1 Tax=Vanilla planifolia TaxID=51239 RepID=A0A835VGR4_VANPL|nr:hypothetical protein HPP92_001229 [Vanilla planifolia]KAG0501006.1 hypothetical protein HPP92_001078 [Vanilla planifolia]
MHLEAVLLTVISNQMINAQHRQRQASRTTVLAGSTERRRMLIRGRSMGVYRRPDEPGLVVGPKDECNPGRDLGMVRGFILQHDTKHLGFSARSFVE